MFVSAISIYQFKNYLGAQLAFDKKVNCFVGENGAGKTNLLDALYYTCITKSYFNNKEASNIYFEKDFFRIESSVKTEDEIAKIKITYTPDRGKEVALNDVKYDRLSEHVGKFPVIIITPDDNRLILGSSEERRRFIDTLLCQLDKEYLRHLQIYNRQLQQRNALLKRFAELNQFNRQALLAYEVPMSESGTYISNKRAWLVAELQDDFQKMYGQIAGEKEKVSMNYDSEVYQKDMRALFEENLMIDRKVKRCSQGIHRDDIAFEMNGYKVKQFSSQGQQKSYLIALKLAQVRLLENISGKKPLLLLDDIFDKLDEKRGKHLLQFILSPDFGQVFITDTSQQRILQNFEDNEGAIAIFKIKNGNINV